MRLAKSSHTEGINTSRKSSGYFTYVMQIPAATGGYEKLDHYRRKII